MSDTELCNAMTLLGVDWTADDAAIRKAWRALVRSYHPDLARRDRHAANRRLAEINAAYDVVAAHSTSERARILRPATTNRAARQGRNNAAQRADTSPNAAASDNEPKHEAAERHRAQTPRTECKTTAARHCLAASACQAFEATISVLHSATRPPSRVIYA